MIICLNLFFTDSRISLGAGNNAGKNEQAAKVWSFGQSVDRKDNIWKKGKAGNAINKHQKKGNADAIDTASSIEKALREAEKKTSIKGKLGLSLEEDSSSWAVAPDQKETRIDEEMVREKRHILRAFTEVEKGNDFKMSIGPELILRDEEHSAESAISDQPDSSFGLGMKFKYDF